MNLGAEYWFKFLALRLGYKSATDLDSSSHWGYGMGLDLGAYGIDYAFVPYSDLGDTHRLSILMRF